MTDDDRAPTGIEEKAIRIGMDYIYTNPVTRFVTVWGLKRCADLRVRKNRVLDLGCGRGDLFPFVARRPFSEYIGLDQSEGFLSLAERRFPAATWIRGDAFNLPFEDGSVDSILSFSVLEHLSPLESALDEMLRIMANDGEFIFGIPTEGLAFRLGRRLTTKPYIEKRVDVDYMDLVAKEHINDCRSILAAVRSRFALSRLHGIPFGVPLRHANVFLIGRCTPRGEG